MSASDEGKPRTVDRGGDALRTRAESVSDILEQLLEGELADKVRRALQAKKIKLSEEKERITHDLRESKERLREKLTQRVRKAVTGDEAQPVRDHVKKRVKEVQTRVRAKTLEPRVSRLVDQYSFTVGVVGIVVSQYVLLSHSAWFHVWYALLVPRMYLVKWAMYKMRKMHYFLLDFCYYMNALLLVWLFVPGLRESCGLAKAIFVLANNTILEIHEIESEHARAL
eukprot:g4902.t1